MAIDFAPGHSAPNYQPPLGGVVPDAIPMGIEQEVISSNLRDSVHGHVILCAAAEAVADAVRPQAESLSEVQVRVDEWMATNAPGEMSKNAVRQLFDDLYAGRLGQVSLYDLDATVAFAGRLWAENLASRHGTHVSSLGRSVLEDAPALLYVPLENRVKVAESLGLSNGRLSELYEQRAQNMVSGKIDSLEKADVNKQATVARPEHHGDGQERLKFSVRDAKAKDIAAMVEVDMRSFSRVYEEYGMTEDELRADLTEKFRNRYRLLGGKWMPVVTTKDEDGNERIVGFMVGCPTNKGPADFESWEKTTNNGTLDGLYDPKGNHLYVVTLSMDPSVHDQKGEDQAYMRVVSRMIEERLDYAYFESRMPGFRTWVKYKHCKPQGLDFNQVSQDEEELTRLANHYASLTKVVDGKEVPYDKLLRKYSIDFGCDLNRVAPEAYKDAPSMNFGAVYTFENPLPKNRRGKIASWMTGRSLGIAAKSTSINQRVMKQLQKLFE